MEGPDDAEQRRLVDSSLWKENVLTQGHTSVWGSWYSSEAHRWGYACCRSLDRCCACTSGRAPAPGSCPDGGAAGEGGDQDDSAADSDATDSEDAQRFAEEKPFDWTAAVPAELLSREAIAAQDGKPGAFVAHFVRFAVGAWRHLLEGEGDGARGEEESLEAFRNAQSLQDAEAALEPLMRQLNSGEVKPTVMQQLDKMVSLAAEREYAEAGKAYIDMVLGKKKWNNVIASYGGTGGTNKGARIYITKQDDLVEFDKDPVVQKYMQCLRRLVLVAQYVRPNSDTSKHLVI
mmetsp:Transcript_16747/g.46053  ORF Transcript_16747/g.46053 Transcript_16747/m.46053 type:complete len:290 (-) Transcript_16747:55-924(-)